MCRPALRTFLLAAWSAGSIFAAPAPALPPLSSELSGQLTFPRIAGFPSLAWQVETRPTPGAGLVVSAKATAPGLTLHADVTPPLGDAPGTWRLIRATLDAPAWWRLVADQVAPNAKLLPPDFELSGVLTMEGSGEWRGAELSGSLRIRLADATARSVAQNWSATGLALDAAIDLTASRPALRTVELRVATAQVAGISAQQILLSAVRADANRLSIQRAELNAFGGRISLSAFTFDPAAPAVKSVAEFSRVALGDLAALVPQALTEAHGRVAGRVSVNWSLKSGVGSGNGDLAVSPGEAATVRLAPSPGLLTGRSPPRIGLLPAFTGPLRRWLSVENPAHAMLQRIELGQVPLALENLTLQLYPDGAEATRTALVQVVARTTGVGDVIEKVTFTVNVSGPLEQVVRLGLDDRAKLRFNAPK